MRRILLSVLMAMAGYLGMNVGAKITQSMPYRLRWLAPITADAPSGYFPI